MPKGAAWPGAPFCAHDRRARLGRRRIPTAKANPLHLSDSGSAQPRALTAATTAATAGVSIANLRRTVEQLSFPRPLGRASANRRARDTLTGLIGDCGLSTMVLGPYENLAVRLGSRPAEPVIVFGAHYDSVGESPGSDDNASAVAVCLEVARLIAVHKLGPALAVFFNGEEDGLLGSRDFVADAISGALGKIAEAHVFEMVGYRDRRSGSQRLPTGLPIPTPPAGDFLALIADHRSGVPADALLGLARAGAVADCPVLALSLDPQEVKAFPEFIRSDHAAFWEAGIPALMWTDTSEFRNPHYHRATDTPETLDYDFMADVARLALARAADWASREGRAVQEP